VTITTTVAEKKLEGSKSSSKEVTVPSKYLADIRISLDDRNWLRFTENLAQRLPQEETGRRSRQETATIDKGLAFVNFHNRIGMLIATEVATTKLAVKVVGYHYQIKMSKIVEKETLLVIVADK
jgi:hypothetical protein